MKKGSSVWLGHAHLARGSRARRLGHLILICMILALGLIVSAAAQTSMSSWRFFMEVNAGAPGFYSLTVPLDVFDKSRDDLADLRLLDASGKEVPYAIWLRRELDEQREVTGRLFNQATKGTASEVSVDLGADGVEHNEVEIETAGTNFRRRVEVEGSDNGNRLEGPEIGRGDFWFWISEQIGAIEPHRLSGEQISLSSHPRFCGRTCGQAGAGDLKRARYRGGASAGRAGELAFGDA